MLDEGCDDNTTATQLDIYESKVLPGCGWHVLEGDEEGEPLMLHRAGDDGGADSIFEIDLGVTSCGVLG